MLTGDACLPACHRRLANGDPARHTTTRSGDATTIDVDALQRVMLEVLPEIWRQLQAQHLDAVDLGRVLTLP